MAVSKTVLVAGLLALAACGVTPDVRIGESEQALVAQLGPPAASTQDGDARVLTYRIPQTATLPGTGPTPWDSGYTQWGEPTNDPGAEPPETVVTGICTLRYRVVGGVVQSWQHSGKGC